uniref:Uncharacterized protein MANES_16G014000 n=1 Tax=Rhizophora mucronata TaxID=61149 RepID=A0A2P2IZ22_RHIMU
MPGRRQHRGLQGLRQTGRPRYSPTLSCRKSGHCMVR